MRNNFFSLQKPSHDIYGRKIKRRKPFKETTKKNEWMSAGGSDAIRGKLKKKSKCRNCPRVLTWGDRSYEFDHKDNNNSNNSQSNCYLVCRICHGKATIIKKKRVKDRLTGRVIGHKTIKKKTGYKRIRRSVTKKRTNRRANKGNFFYNPGNTFFKL